MAHGVGVIVDVDGVVEAHRSAKLEALANGTFLLFKDKRKNTQVQVQTQRCYQSEAQVCTCGLVAQQDNSVVKIDMCHSAHSLPTVVTFDMEGRKPTVNILRQHDGRLLIIRLSSGTFIQVVLEKWGMSFLLTVPAMNTSDVAGVCTLTEGGRRDLDTILDGYSQSLFLEESRDHLDPTGTDIQNRLPSTLSNEKARYSGLEKHRGQRTPRGDIPAGLVWIKDTGYDMHSGSLSWPTSSGLTEAHVRQLCEDTMSNVTTSDMCSDYIDRHRKELSQICVAGTTPEAIATDGLCDTRSSSCDVATVYGKHFLNLPTLVCEASRVEMNGSGVWIAVQRNVTVPARFMESTSVDCRLPDRSFLSESGVAGHTTWEIKVSNDKVHFSNSVRITVFDSSCELCSVADDRPNCTIQERRCLIDGECFVEAETHPSDFCLACVVGRSTQHWSPNPGKARSLAYYLRH
ncbi:hypothetical protein HPB47_022835 [Ixodes persulcatus]|uniref:Uncharacterized protein n=1 Tax=Ixodes persulcatus TaxID=34615 RepID=A0AC60QBZ8_IXOPE|nr:hypothetical protein HPB47_022835 [Ixodes persulcatus]